MTWGSFLLYAAPANPFVCSEDIGVFLLCPSFLVFLIFSFNLHQLFQYNEKEMTKTNWCEAKTSYDFHGTE